jgi:hypothetical protein
MNPRILKLCAWSGLACLVIMAIGFVGMAHFVPPPSPHDTATATAHRFITHRTGIRFGMIVSMAAAALLAPFAAAITVQMRRIEGTHSALAFVQLALGSIFVLEFIYLLFFWQVATFRTGRSADEIQLLNDMAWIPFVGLSSTLILQSGVFAVAILMDRRAVPVFPRWLGYFNLFAAMMFSPGTFNVFFKTGPLAWNGLVAFYIPVAVFVVWLVLNSWQLARAVDHQVAEDAAHAPARAASAEIAELRARLDALDSVRALTTVDVSEH